MNKQPVYYMQTDSRWKNVSYSAPGESTTIGKAGCGPTCAAMLIETMTGKTFTPVDACAWAVKKGYKAKNQGTYYSYFAEQFKAKGISCRQLNWNSLYGNSASSVHKEAFDLLKAGYYLIACMGKGTWTSSGHFVVIWWEDGKVRINDPNSKAANRMNGDLATFKAQVKYYWAVDARQFNKNGKAEPDAAAKPASKPATKKEPKMEPAYSFSKEYAKTYKVTASSLNVRCGAGTNKEITDVMKKGEVFICYGYYTKLKDGSVWLYGIAHGKVGHCSKKYLA